MPRSDRLSTLAPILVDLLLLIALATMGASGYLMEQAHQEHRDLVGLSGDGWHEVHLFTFFLLLGLGVVHVLIHWRAFVTRWLSALRP
jgi:hypothetical protein